MTTFGPVSGEEIVLDGVRYPIVGAVVRQLISVYPGKITIGDNSQASDPYRSYWSQSDWTGGIGINRLRGEQHIDRVWWSTLNLSHRGQLSLPRRADAVPKPTGATAFKGFGELGGRLYAVFGRDVYRYDGASWSASLHTLGDDFNVITNGDLEGIEYLLIAHENGVAYSSDGDTWLDTGAV